ncbi:hypothetical protein GF345_03420 [Candidatus Woesearchaeota archaeon]|nr:hypothetical protein [Candidatus Woesearchaeota archaeon]
MKSAEVQTDELQVSGISDSHVRGFIDRCIHESAKTAIYITAANGGYLDPSGSEAYGEEGDGANFKHYYFENSELPFVMKGDTILLRDKTEIERVISNYVSVESDKCINNLEAFSGQGIRFEFENFSQNAVVHTMINAEDVMVTADWKVSIAEGNSINTIERFSSDLDLRLGILYSTLESILTGISSENNYDIREHCHEYSSDPLINIYLESNTYTYEYVIRIIDAGPLLRADIPLKFKAAVKNMNLSGDCIG